MPVFLEGDLTQISNLNSTNEPLGVYLHLYLCGFEWMNCMTAAYGVKLRSQEVVQYATSRTARGDHCWAQQTRRGESLRLLSYYGRVRASMGTSCGVSRVSVRRNKPLGASTTGEAFLAGQDRRQSAETQGSDSCRSRRFRWR